MDKKAVELSMNFLVMILISIAVLSMAIIISRNIFTGAKNLQLDIDRQTQQEIENLLDDGSRVVIPFTRKTVNRGDLAVFGVGVLNVLGDTKYFNISVKVNTAFDNEKNAIINPANYLNLVLSGLSEIENNKNHKFSFGVDVEKDAPSGTYILDVSVLYGSDVAMIDSAYGEFPVTKVFVTVS